MQIAICDNNLECRNSVYTYVKYYSEINNLDTAIFVFEDGGSLLEEKTTFDILFLDIELGDVNGITVAERILKSSPNTIVIIITNYRKYLDAAMDVNVLRFIDKPITQERITSALEKAIDEINHSHILIHTKENTIKKLKKSDIIYVEVLRKTTTFYTTSGIVQCNEPISRFRELLNCTFFAVPHNSYIVNLNYVSLFKRDTIEITSSLFSVVKISVAPRKQAKFRKQFMSFIEGED